MGFALGQRIPLGSAWPLRFAEAVKPVDLPPIPLPSNWNQSAKTAFLAAFTLAPFVITALI